MKRALTSFKDALQSTQADYKVVRLELTVKHVKVNGDIAPEEVGDSAGCICGRHSVMLLSPVIKPAGPQLHYHHGTMRLRETGKAIRKKVQGKLWVCEMFTAVTTRIPVVPQQWP